MVESFDASRLAASLAKPKISVDALGEAWWRLRHEKPAPNTLKLSYTAFYRLRSDTKIMTVINPRDLSGRCNLPPIFGLRIWLVPDRFEKDDFWEILHIGPRPLGSW